MLWKYYITFCPVECSRDFAAILGGFALSATFCPPSTPLLTSCLGRHGLAQAPPSLMQLGRMGESLLKTPFRWQQHVSDSLIRTIKEKTILNVKCMFIIRSKQCTNRIKGVISQSTASIRTFWSGLCTYITHAGIVATQGVRDQSHRDII